MLGRLILKRTTNEEVVIRHGDEKLRLIIGKVGEKWVELQFIGPQSFQIDRLEVANRKAEFAAEPDPQIEEDLKQLTTSPTGEVKRGAF